MTKRYPVRAPKLAAIGGVLFFGTCAVVLFWAAMDGRGLVLNRVIDLGPDVARVVLLVLAALSLGLVGMAVLALLLRQDRELVLEDESITLPAPSYKRNQPSVVRYADITELREQQISGQHFVNVYTRTGKHWIARSQLPAGAYDEILRVLRARSPRST